MEKNIGKKEKQTNKGTDKQYVADSLMHNTTYHTRFCTKFQNARSSSCRKIFDEKKVYTHTNTYTHTHRTSKNYIPPIYFVYRGITIVYAGNKALSSLFNFRCVI